MALFTIENVAIKGVSGAVPNNKVETKDLDIFNREEAETFVKTVGIESRYMADNNTCASDLCYHAADKLITEINWNKEEIDILLFESVTADYRTPPTSCILQDRLGLPNSCFTMDIPMGCAGFLYAITVAGRMMSSGNVKKALVLVGDTITRMSSPRDKSRVPLFGDCGTAVALEYDDNAHDIIVEFNTDGKGYDALITPHSGFRHQVTPESFTYEDFGNGVARAPVHSVIKGMDVYAFAIGKPPKSLIQLMEKFQLDKDKDVDYYLIHQANRLIVDVLVKKAKLNPNKVPMNIDNFANLGGASIPMLMVSELRDELSNRSLSLVLSAFGLGLTWSTAILKTDPIVVPDLILV